MLVNKSLAFLSAAIPLIEVLADDKTVLSRGGFITQVLYVKGCDYTGRDTASLEADYQNRKGFFGKLPEGFNIAIHAQRRAVDYVPEDYQARGAAFTSALAKAISEKRHGSLEGLYVNHTFICVSYKLPAFKIGNKASIARNNEAIERAASTLSNQVQLCAAYLEQYSGQILTKEGEGALSLLGFWSYIANGGKAYVTPQKSCYLGKLLAASTISFDKDDTIEISAIDGKRFAAFLSINDFVMETNYQLLERLYSINHPFSIIHYIQPFNQEKAKKHISGLIGNLNSVASFTSHRLADLADAAACLDADKIVLHKYAISIAVYGNSKAHLEQGIRQIRSEFNRSGFDLIRETIHLSAAFWSQYPEYSAFQEPTSALMTTSNMADFITFAGNDTGNVSSPLGNAPVCVFKTAASTPYNFNFHALQNNETVGHTMIIGGTGKGKTTLIMYLLMECMKFRGFDDAAPLKFLLIDSGNGTKIPVTALGGQFTNFSEREGLQLNPLQLPDTPENRAFLQDWFEVLAGGVNEREKELIAKAVGDIFIPSLSLKDKKLSFLEHSFDLEGYNALTGETNLLNRLSKWWDKNHKNGAFFNADYDSLQGLYEKQMVAYDMAGILNDSELLAPVFRYITHGFFAKIKQNRAPYIIFIDEMWQYLNHPMIGPFILKAILEGRKKNGLCIGAVQTPNVLVESENGRQAVQNSSTLIIFQNSRAEEAHYIDGLGLTDREFAWVKNEDATERHVLVKHPGGKSVVLNVNLHGLGEYLPIFKSHTSNIARMEQLQREYGDDGWLKHYLATN